MAKHLKELIGNGPPASGKSFGRKEVKKRFGITVFTLSTGDLVRRRLETDAEFERKFGPLVARGGLVPDELLLPMVEAEYSRGLGMGNHELIYFDGVFRNAKQLKHGVKAGMIHPENCWSFLLNSSAHVSGTRYAERATAPTDDEEKRSDAESFMERFRLFQSQKDELIQQKHELGIHVFHLDADRNLEREVMPEILQLTEALVHEKPVPTWIPRSHPIPKDPTERVRNSLRRQGRLPQQSALPVPGMILSPA